MNNNDMPRNNNTMKCFAFAKRFPLPVRANSVVQLHYSRCVVGGFYVKRGSCRGFLRWSCPQA